MRNALCRSGILLIAAALLAAASPLRSVAEESHPELSDVEIESLLAPIALYPDALLTQVLIAATYPLEVVAAARWARANPELEGAAAVAATKAFGWDSSVQALTAFPEILARMDADLDWTQTLGEAFLAQEEAVMAAVQTLRRRAQVAGTLERPEHLRLDHDGDAISLRPSRDELVYIPWYDTRQAYGSWPSTRHPPIYWDPIAWHHSGRGARSPFLWGPAILLDPLYYPTRIDWHRRGVIVVHRGSPAADKSPRWQHEPKHRRGVRYRRPDVEDRYSKREWYGTRRGHPDRRDRRSDHGRRGDRGQPPATWPDQPTASLSQHRAGAIDTRTATERLRAMQAESARASAESRRSRETRRESRRSATPGSRSSRHSSVEAATPSAEAVTAPRRESRSTVRRSGRPDASDRSSPSSASRSSSGSRPDTSPPRGLSERRSGPVMRPANTPPEVRTAPAQRPPQGRQGVRTSRPDQGAGTRRAGGRPGQARPE